MRAETMFREYKRMKQELSVLHFQLKQFKGLDADSLIEAMRLSHLVNDERVQTSTSSDKTEKVAMNYRKVLEKENDEWFAFLWNRYMEIRGEIDFFEASIANLPGELALVTMDLVRGEITWDTMMKKYNVSHAMIGKYRKAAIKQLDVGYEIRDKETEIYILS